MLARSSDMELAGYQYRDPEQVLRDVLDRARIRDGDVAVALVREPSTDQEVVEVRVVAPWEWRDLDDAWEHGRLLYRLVEEMRLRPASPPRHSIMTIVARCGFAVFGPDEGRWTQAWLYSNAFDVYKGSVMVMTPAGWVDFDTLWAGPEPRMIA